MSIQDDARSIDIHVGGQTFRISRDGSRITDAPPPPYAGHEAQVQDGQPRASSESRGRGRHLGEPGPATASFRGGSASGSSVFDHFFSEGDDETTHRGIDTPRQTSRATSPQPSFQANILNPSEVDMPSPIDADSHRLSVAGEDTETPSRNWSYKRGPDIISVAPEARKLRSVSQNDLPLLHPRLSGPLVRRNGVRLPTILTNSFDDSDGLGPSSARYAARERLVRSPPAIRSAGAVLYTNYRDEVAPHSPTYIGRDARGIFPPFSSRQGPNVIPMADENLNGTSRDYEDIEERDETGLPLPMDNENDISLHYARLMRRLDRDHRKALHLKDKELERFRERLNEMDTVYRQELKFRDFVIDDLKRRLDYLEEKSESAVEKARNEVENLWERRWKIQSEKLMEFRTRHIEETVQKAVERLAENGKAAGVIGIAPATETSGQAG